MDDGIRKAHLGELDAPRDLLKRPDSNAGLSHVEEKARDTATLRNRPVCAREQKSPIGDRPVARPDLLAVHDEDVAAVIGARSETCEVRAGIRLGVELTPDLVAGEDPVEVAMPLAFAAVREQRRSHDADPQIVDRRWRIDARHLVNDDRLPDERGVLSTIRARPPHAHVAGAIQLTMPRPALRQRAQRLPRHVVLEPAARTRAKRRVVRRVTQIHREPFDLARAAETRKLG
jgi:hypothetical protein